MLAHLIQYCTAWRRRPIARGSSISMKIGAIFLVIWLLAAANVLLVRSMLLDLNGVAETVNVAGMLRMLSQKIAFETVKAVRQQDLGKSEAQNAIRNYEIALRALVQGGAAFGYSVKQPSPQLTTRLVAIQVDWANNYGAPASCICSIRSGRNNAACCKCWACCCWMCWCCVWCS